MKVVRFLQDHAPHMKGETASFSDYDGGELVNAGVAELVNHYERQPDQRVVDNVDENGRVTKLEVRHVPDDLQREADLPPTEAGGRPKDEEHMTEKEKKHRLQNGEAQSQPETRSIDAPQVSKMVSRPQAKK